MLKLWGITYWNKCPLTSKAIGHPSLFLTIYIIWFNIMKMHISCQISYDLTGIEGHKRSLSSKRHSALSTLWRWTFQVKFPLISKVTKGHLYVQKNSALIKTLAYDNVFVNNCFPLYLKSTKGKFCTDSYNYKRGQISHLI